MNWVMNWSLMKRKLPKILNDFFVNITASIDISEVEENLTKTNEIRNPIDIAVNAYKRHPSIQLIKQRVTVSEKFSFQHVSIKDIFSKLKSLDPTKDSLFGSIPEKTFTKHSDLFAPLVQFFIYESIDRGKFPKELKKGEITSLFKMVMPLLKRITGQKQSHRLYPRFPK